MATDEQPSRDAGNAFRPTLIFSAIGFLVNFGFSLITPVLPLYALTFDVTLAMVGTLVASIGISKVLLDIPAGVVADRIGTRRFMLVGLIIITSSALVSAFAIDYWMLLVGLILQGIGTAIFFTTSYLGVSRLCPPSKRGQHLSVFISLQFLGATSGPVLGGFLGQTFGLGAPFLLYAGLAGASALAVHFLIGRSLLEWTREGTIDYRQISRSLRNYTLASINIGLLSISVLRIGLISTILPIFAVRNLGLSLTEFGAVLTLFSFFNFVVLLPAGSLTDRFGRRPFLFASLMLSGVLAVMIPFSGGIFVFTVIMAAMGIALGLSGAIGAWVTDVSPPGDLGASMGLFRTMGDVGSFIGPIVLTVFLPLNMGDIGVEPFAVAALLTSGSSLLLIRARDPAGANGRKRG